MDKISDQIKDQWIESYSKRLSELLGFEQSKCADNARSAYEGLSGGAVDVDPVIAADDEFEEWGY